MRGPIDIPVEFPSLHGFLAAVRANSPANYSFILNSLQYYTKNLIKNVIDGEMCNNFATLPLRRSFNSITFLSGVA
jgi:hypothetical protein